MKKLAVAICLVLSASVSRGQFHKTDHQTKDIVLGVADEITSVLLSEKRVLNIYLPEGYSTDTAHYPVIYLLDGGVDEDFIHTVGLVQFNTFPWVNRIPRSIVVGIANTDRKRDMAFPTTVKSDKEKYPTTGGSDKFIAFLEKELQPYIQKQYRAGGAKMLIGQSLAGLLATEVLFKKPYLFDKYVIISPSLWWDNGSLLKQKMAVPGVAQNTKIYVGVGKEGPAPSVEPHTMEGDAKQLVEKINGAGNKKVKVYFDYLPDEDHATIEHQAIFNAFRKLYPAPDKK